MEFHHTVSRIVCVCVGGVGGCGGSLDPRFFPK